MSVTQSEYAVIGALCLDSGLIDKFNSFLSPDDFTQTHCIKLYTAFCEAASPMDTDDAVNVLEADIGHSAALKFVKMCLDASPSAAMAEHHAKTVHDAGMLRRLRDALNAAILQATNAEDLAEQVAGLAQDQLTRQNGAGHTLMTALRDVVIGLEHRNDGRIDTGFGRLDNLLKGLRGGQLIICGARPAVGKSAFALNVALSVAERYGKVILFSMEMTEHEIGERAIATTGAIQLDELLDGDGDSVAKRIVDPAGELSKLNTIVIDDRPCLTIGQLRAKVRQHPDAKLVIVDYLGLMQTARKENRNIELGQLARDLKTFAAEANVPILALSQLNRGVDDTERPTLRSLRDSGELEQHADKVLLMWRTEQGLTAVDVAKNRQGRTGIVQFEFNGSSMSFKESPLVYEIPKKKRNFLDG